MTRHGALVAALIAFLVSLSSFPTLGAARLQAPPGPPEDTALLIDILAKPFTPQVPEREVSLQCRQHSQFYLRALGKLTPWALHMYDASTKIPSSLMAGNVIQLGNFDQCVAIAVPGQDGGPSLFHGQHCTAAVTFKMPAAPGESTIGDLLLAAANASGVRPGSVSAVYEWSYCVPSSCSASDVQAALRHRLSLLGSTPAVSVAPQRCQVAGGGGKSKNNAPLDSCDIGFICLLLVAAYLLTASTVYDSLYFSKKEASGRQMSRVQQILVTFSLRRNGSALLSTSTSSDTLGCINGLRVLSTCWVVLLHSSYIAAVSPTINMAVVPTLGDYWGNMVVLNATLSTDTFFLLSGTLLAISFLRSAGRGCFNPIAFYWHRYMRLTPVYAVMVWFYASLLVRTGSGPMWDKVVGWDRDNCVENWWTNLAYVNNFIGIASPCMNQTWYLAVDMQLFWLSPLLLIPLWRWPRVFRVLLPLVIVTAMAVPFVITFLGKLTGAMLYTKDQNMLGLVYVEVYSRVYNRAGPYLIGLALGYALFACRGKVVIIPKVLVVAGWLMSTATCLSVLFGVYGFYQTSYQYSALEAALYAGIHRTAWGAGVAWVVFACVKGYGGPVDAILSWRALAPLSRLSYSVYLCHYAVLLINQGLRRSPGYFSPYVVIHGALGTIVVSVVVSVGLSLAFEMPFLALDRVLLPRSSASKKPRAEDAASASSCTSVNANKVKDQDEPASSFDSEEGLVSETQRARAYAAADDRANVMRGYDNAGFEK